MNLGISLYSLNGSVQKGNMDIPGVIEWIERKGAKHIEISAVGFDLEEDKDLCQSIIKKTKEVDIQVSNYLIAGNFIQPSATEFEKEIQRVKRHVDIAAQLGCQIMRHDVAQWEYREKDVLEFEGHFDRLVEACTRIAHYASRYGITTTIENHGFFVQSSDRVLRLIKSVNRPNFKLTLDIGNFLCVDEDPVTAVKKCLPYAEMIHFKDFLIRPSNRNPGDGWLTTAGGNYIRGTIFGHGDLDLYRIIEIIKGAGYDKPISIEFEGPEENELALHLGFNNAVRLWDEITPC